MFNPFSICNQSFEKIPTILAIHNFHSLMSIYFLQFKIIEKSIDLNMKILNLHEIPSNNLLIKTLSNREIGSLMEVFERSELIQLYLES